MMISTSFVRIFLPLVLVTVSLNIYGQTAQSFSDLIKGMPPPTPISNKTVINEFGNCKFYRDLAEFQTACGIFPVEDFEGSRVFNVLNCPNPINSASTNCFPMGMLLPGFSITAPIGNSVSNIVVAAAGFSSRVSSDMVGANEFASPLEISFDASDITAVSFDLTTETAQGDVQVDIYDLSNLHIGTAMINTVGTEAQFVAFSDVRPISKIVINSMNNQIELIDNLSFGACIQKPIIPTIGQWSLTILALVMASLGLIFIYKRMEAIA